jgi:FKBP12-rapamycin complex-associated protein
MQRDKYPERIPFRLTRMLTSAMEVGAIDGHFRATCVGAMAVLRRHKDSVMAMLEAFVHDPLVNWCGLRTRAGVAAALSCTPSKPCADGRTG